MDLRDKVKAAIERARCPGREGPFGGYDYGFNTDFYGPEPEGGRYVIRDYRDPSSPDWGKWVHQTTDLELHESEFERMTQWHIAQAAIDTVFAELRNVTPGMVRAGCDPIFNPDTDESPSKIVTATFLAMLDAAQKGE